MQDPLSGTALGSGLTPDASASQREPFAAAYSEAHADMDTRSGMELGSGLVPERRYSQREPFAAAYSEAHADMDTRSGMALGSGLTPDASASQREPFVGGYGRGHEDKDTLSHLGPGAVPLEGATIAANEEVFAHMAAGREIVLAVRPTSPRKSEKQPEAKPISSAGAAAAIEAAAEQLENADYFGSSCAQPTRNILPRDARLAPAPGREDAAKAHAHALGLDRVAGKDDLGPIADWDAAREPLRSTAADAFKWHTDEAAAAGRPYGQSPLARTQAPAVAEAAAEAAHSGRRGSRRGERPRLDPAALPAAGLSPAEARMHAQQVAETSRARAREAGEVQAAAKGARSPHPKSPVFAAFAAADRGSPRPGTPLSSAQESYGWHTADAVKAAQRSPAAGRARPSPVASPSRRGAADAEASPYSRSSSSAHMPQSTAKSSYGAHTISAIGRGARAHLGLWTGGDHMHVLLPRHAAAPCAASAVFSTTREGQTEVCVAVLQGGRARASDNAVVWRGDVRVPAAPAGSARVEVTLALDDAERLEVRTEVVGTGDVVVLREGRDGKMHRM